MSDSIQQIQGYEVLDDGKPAVSRFQRNATHFFTTWEDALKYCKHYLNVWSDLLPETWQGELFTFPNGSTIEIRFQSGIES